MVIVDFILYIRVCHVQQNAIKDGMTNDFNTDTASHYWANVSSDEIVPASLSSGLMEEIFTLKEVS